VAGPLVETESERITAPARGAGTRTALLTFCALEVLAVPLMLRWDRGTWFQLADWDFLASRTGGDLGDLFRPHYEHWTTLPILAYRLMWQAFGVHSAAP
jgi:hypothetical protein